jgi:hypothetical protein
VCPYSPEALGNAGFSCNIFCVDDLETPAVMKYIIIVIINRYKVPSGEIEYVKRKK